MATRRRTLETFALIRCRPRNRRVSSRRLAVETLEKRQLLAAGLEFRSFDGWGNNVSNPHWGEADTRLLRLTTVSYGAGMEGDFPALAPRLDSSGQTINPRTVSNLLMDQDASVENDRGLTSVTFQWGQFLDHDMDLTEDFAPVGEAQMEEEFIPFFVTDPGDELPMGTMIPMLRSRYEMDHAGVAQQINQISSYIDASSVYGSDEDRADALRSRLGGFLLTSDGVTNLDDGTGEFMPLNTIGVENASPPTTGTGVPLNPEDLFAAGDARSNEQPGLTAMHTLFVREHNYQAARLAEQLDLDEDDLADPEVDEQLYQLARAIVGAEIQSITYNEFLPSLLGPNQLSTYDGYRDDVNASIANIFSASLYRVGHTMLPEELLLQNNDGSPVEDDPDVLGASVENGQVSLAEAFFNPQLVTQFGIEPHLKGLADQLIQEVDHLIADGMRNMLFSPPAAIDLGATNLQRGRDHGLPDYNQARVDFGLAPVKDFSEISSDKKVVKRLRAAYDAEHDGIDGYRAIDNIDVFAGAISEDRIHGGSVGELLHTVLVDQFTRLRDGDRFFYENVFSGELLDEINDTRLSDIIRRNTDLQSIQDEVFRADNVLTLRGQESEGRLNVTLRVRRGRFQIYDHRAGRIVAQAPLSKTDIVAVYGTSRNDVIRVDGSVAKWSGALELHGGGGVDRLIIQAARAADDVVVTANHVQLNDLSLSHGNFEKLVIKTGRGDERAIVSERLYTTMMLLGGSGSDTLFGREGEDILVAGALPSDTNIDFVRDVWTGHQSHQDRMSILRDAVNLSEDETRDILFGGLERDWMLKNDLDFSIF